MRGRAVFFGFVLSACGASQASPVPTTSADDELLSEADGSPARDAGERALAEGRLEEAKLLLREAVEADASDARAKLHLALAHDLSGDAAEAERILRELVAERPTMARAWSNLGSVLLDRGADDEALSCFARALEADPGLAEA